MMNDWKKIIVVDDNVENLTSIKNTLKDMYEVYPSLSALKMFSLLERLQPDLILLDVKMPEMDGYEAAQKLKNDDKYREIPIIFLTSMNDAQSEMEGLKLGAIDYIYKPFVAPLLLRRIETHLSLIDYQREAQNASHVMESLAAQRTGALALETSRHKAIIDSIPDLLFCKDTDLKYTQCNDTFEQFMGISELDFLGKSDKDGAWFSPEDAERINETERTVINENRKYVTVEKIRSPSTGKECVFETVKAPIKQDGDVVGIVAILRDISQRKET